MAMPLKFTQNTLLRLTPALHVAIDKWAKQHKLSRAEAIRQLVEQALEEEGYRADTVETVIGMSKEIGHGKPPD
jgi:metal-responsive CopG/Arc/MetJ family transcriptional regulator